MTQELTGGTVVNTQEKMRDALKDSFGIIVPAGNEILDVFIFTNSLGSTFGNYSLKNSDGYRTHHQI